MGGRGQAQGLEAGRPRGGPAAQSGGSPQRPPPHTGLVTWLRGLPLERAPTVHASGFKEPDSRRRGLFICFKSKRGAPANLHFQLRKRGVRTHTSQTDFSTFVFLTRCKPRGWEKVPLTCWGLLSPDVSSGCCVNTATLSTWPSQGADVICQGEDPTQPLWGARAWFKGRVGIRTPRMTQLSPLQRPSLHPSGSLFLGRAVLLRAAADRPALIVPGAGGGYKGGRGEARG